MRRVMITRALLLAAGCLTACAHAPARQERRAQTPSDFFPLAVGNEWTYADRSPLLGPQAQAASRRVVRIVSRDADGYYRDSERGELRADADCLRDRIRRLLCLPLEPGRGWTSVVGVSSTERYEIAAVDEEVEVPAGTFRGCVRVRAHNRGGPTTDHVLELTYAPGIGPVRIETHSVVNGVVTPQVRAVLESYRLVAR